MTIKYLSSETEKIQNQTVSGIDICATLVAKAGEVLTGGSPNEYLNPLSQYFDPSNVHIKVVLKRDRQEHILISDNLAVLGHFATITQGRDQWTEGVQLSTTESAHLLYLPFSGNTNNQAHVYVSGEDTLEVYINIVKGAYGSKLDANACVFEARACPSIGIETYIPFISVHSVRGNQSSELVQCGNNVTRIALISMSDGSETAPNAFTDVTINSDRLDKSFNANQLILEHSKSIEDSVRTHADAIDTYLIHEDIEIDNCKVNLKMNPSKIRDNTNYLVYSRFVTSTDIVRKAQNMMLKHQSADLGKIKDSL